jgi:hypothetical protein
MNIRQRRLKAIYAARAAEQNAIQKEAAKKNAGKPLDTSVLYVKSSTWPSSLR